MSKNQYLRNIVAVALDTIEAKYGHSDFTKRDIIHEALKVESLANFISQGNRSYPDLGVGEMVGKALKYELDALMQVTDEYGIRKYESYRAGKDWRWLLFDNLNANTMRSVWETRRAKDQRSADITKAYRDVLELLEGHPGSTVREIRTLVNEVFTSRVPA